MNTVALKNPQPQIQKIAAFSRMNQKMNHPAKHTMPPSAKKTVSIASIFNQQARVRKSTGTMPQTSKLLKDKSVAKLHDVKSGSTSRGSRKAKSRALKKRPELHPLAAAFKDGSKEYQRQIYQATALKINATLETLLSNLHENTLQVMPPKSDEEDSQASPLKLSLAAKYERMATSLYQPISQFKLTLQNSNAQGEQQRFQATLAIRMANYEDYLADRRSEIENLQKEWEVAVGEIWKLGVSCLGDTVMKDLLFNKQDAQESSSRPSKHIEADFALFIPKQGTSLASPCKPLVNKKHVTFGATDIIDDAGNMPNPSFLDFLYQPSKYRTQVPTVPSIADSEIEELETMISTLGQQQVEEFRKIEKDHHDFWKKKKAQLTRALKTD